MGKYIAGPSVIRLPSRPAVIPGEAFAYDGYSPEQEAMALVSGAISLQPGETSLMDQRAAARAAAELEKAALMPPVEPPAAPSGVDSSDAPVVHDTDLSVPVASVVPDDTVDHKE